MRLGILTALAGVIVISMALVIGCSSSKTTISPTVVYGELTDSEFVPVKAQIDSVLASVVSDVLSGLNNLSVAPGDTSSVQADMTPPSIEPDPDASPDSLVTVYIGDWHYVYATYTGATYFSRLRDSIQYRKDGVVQQNPSSTVDFIHNITNWTFTVLDQNTTHTDYAGRTDFTLENLDLATATINGNFSTTVKNVFIGVDSSFTELYAFDVDVTGFRVSEDAGAWISGCPNSGSLSFNLGYTYSWETNLDFGSGNSNWTATANFSNGTATVTVGNGTTNWQYTVETCSVIQ